jgi:hypothetical protein
MKMYIAIPNDKFNLPKILNKGLTKNDNVDQNGSYSAPPRGHSKESKQWDDPDFERVLLCQKAMFPIDSTSISINVAFEKPSEEVWVDWDDGTSLEEEGICKTNCRKCQNWKEVEECLGSKAVETNHIYGAYVLEIKPEEIIGFGITTYNLPGGDITINNTTGEARVFKARCSLEDAKANIAEWYQGAEL